MPYLIAAIAIVGMLSVLNLLLTYGVIRRLREHGELLAQGRLPAMPNPMVGAGSVITAFSAVTVDGDELVVDDLAPGTLVGFFSLGCSGCLLELPRFVEAAAAHPGGPDRVLAVVIAEEDAAEQVAVLSPRARVVVTTPGAEIEKAFGVQGYPAFALLGEGRVVTASGMLSAVVDTEAKAVA